MTPWKRRSPPHWTKSPHRSLVTASATTATRSNDSAKRSKPAVDDHVILAHPVLGAAYGALGPDVYLQRSQLRFGEPHVIQQPVRLRIGFGETLANDRGEILAAAQSRSQITSVSA